MELTRGEKTVTARVIFEKTTPPAKEDIVLYIAYKENEVLKRIEAPKLGDDMTAEVTVPEELKSCVIEAYVWNSGMKPLMEKERIG